MKTCVGCLCVLACSSFSHAAPSAVGCPETIAVEQHLKAPLEGWKASSTKLPYRFAGLTFFDGPPEENASLVYDSYVKGSGKDIATWRFGANRTRPIWIMCGYSGTSITIAKILPSKLVSCSVIYSTQQQVAGLPLIEQITCR